MSRVNAVISIGGGRKGRGAAAVEMALVAPVLILLLFGIIEFGVLVSALMQLNNVVRSGARVAATGATVAEVEGHMRGSAGRLDEAQMDISMEYRTMSSGMWTAWTMLSDDGTMNTAPTGAQIRITVGYPHQLIVGSLFCSILDATDGTIALESATTMRRE